jgi:molybdopterin converting factor subunit 1
LMRVRVLFFGQLREIVGCAEEEAELSEGTRVEDLFARYGRRFPQLAEFRSAVAPSVNQELAEWRTALEGGDEVAFLPPVSGGEQAAEGDIVRLVRERIGVDEIAASLKAPEDGAVVVFDGIVRNFSIVPGEPREPGARRTLYLEYEAYEPMALAKMREIGAQIHAKFSIHRLVIVHRLGRIEIGETSVLIGVSSPHRGAAFDACRYAIDTLKRTVPIWKKEYFSDGAAWADGAVCGAGAPPSEEALSRPGESTS